MINTRISFAEEKYTKSSKQYAQAVKQKAILMMAGGTGGHIFPALAIADELNSGEEELIKAYFVAGIIGAYFASGPGFSAEEHGCQAGPDSADPGPYLR